MRLRVLAFFLLALWIAQVNIISMLSNWARKNYQEEYRTLNFLKQKSSRHIFRFRSSEDIEWESDGKELLVDGKLYDVLNIEEEKEGIMITCVSDEYEDHLLESCHQLILKQQKDRSGNLVKNNINLCYIFSAQQWEPMSIEVLKNKFRDPVFPRDFPAGKVIYSPPESRLS